MNGGKRPGAGRPKGSKASHTIQAEALKKYLIEQAIAAKAEVIAALIREAKRGDVRAIKELLDRILGRPVDPVELSGKDGGAIQIRGVEITVREPEDLHIKGFDRE